MERLHHVGAGGALGDVMRHGPSGLRPQYADAMLDRVRRIDERFAGERPGGCAGRREDVADAVPAYAEQDGVGVHGDLGSFSRRRNECAWHTPDAAVRVVAVA